MKAFDVEEWLDTDIPAYEGLLAVSVELLKNLLNEGGVDFLSVNGRVKKKDGCLEKIKRKSYSDPKNQLTDVCGIRIVTYFEYQLSQVEKIISDSLDVDVVNSRDQKSVLGDDRIGYRSVHFVCGLGAKRIRLPEYKRFKGLKFEIQVRTVLQHAWAELAHDRTYKFSGALPKHLQRKLNLYSGMLEVVDSGFDSIALEIDSYKLEVESGGISKLLSNEIDSISLFEFMKIICSDYNLSLDEVAIPNSVVEEVSSFGINKISDLYSICTKEAVAWSYEGKSGHTYIGFIRGILIFSDPERYFSDCWKNHWLGMEESFYEKLRQKMGPRKIDRIVRNSSIEILRGF